MPCTTIIVDGLKAIVCTGRQRKKRCVCGAVAPLLCDWKMPGGKTCDIPICGTCAEQVGPDKHLCPGHRKAYAEWKLNRARA